ncbi:two-component system, OmpR family, sensor kinase [Saccharopolyspora antimicrobica]|uniref:histidine kinase n=1 Tax=Saccharopolyspora antimicrobica TaxID=455193 RepID=A0A1I4T617_9PSEU|nr:HAMP domain-containing sensor histidine kinase [Saccharopolyspora antimicrobica]RKT85848.1 two-component system OmpR family sensor kinase [Saccharopolyspora antimicrobica]SFM72139.1 two-component system, OmpR family, sensor kinase [Saccharopolyspora antimicrobica]
MSVFRTLRGRLVLVLLSALVLGLLAMGLTSTALLSRSLIARTDDRLAELSAPWEHGAPLPDPTRAPPERGPGRGELPTEFRVLVFAPGRGQLGGVLGSPEGDAGGPLLVDPERGPEIGTVPDRAGGADWRVRTVALPNGHLAVLALSLAGVEATVRQLVVIELVVGGVVLVVLAAAAAVTVRLSLRPLDRIERTADAIAAGQLDRRVPDQDPRTETGRLGSALNTMLGRLVDALQQREQSEQRLRRFVADASHELRTPLTSIRGFAELYRRSDQHSPEDVRVMMRRIESEAVRMGGLVEDMLLLARLDRERTVDLVELDLVPLVQDVVADGRARAPDREITEREPAQLRVLGDGPRLRQVLTNLVSNALLHSTPGSPITVEVAHGSAGGGALAAAGAELTAGAPVAVVSVADSGPGIAAEHAGRIFDRFYRVDDGRTRESGGTGLGLAITAALAEAHHGRVELRANAEGGCTFRLLLPLTGA